MEQQRLGKAKSLDRKLQPHGKARSQECRESGHCNRRSGGPIQLARMYNEYAQSSRPMICSDGREPPAGRL